MAVKIPGKSPDDRVQQILRDPKGYFANARKQARAAVQAERAQATPVSRDRRRPA